jgi:hypothetical protein
MAASQIMAGCYDTVIAGGVEQITMLSGKQNMDGFVNEKLAESHPGIYHPMGMTAECVANRYNVSRETQDEIAFESQTRTAAAQEAGTKNGEQKKGKATLIGLLGYMNAIKYCDRIILKTNKNLKKYGSNSKNIRETLNYILHREK